MKKNRGEDRKLIEMRYNSVVKKQLMSSTLDGAMTAYAASGFNKKDSHGLSKDMIKDFDKTYRAHLISKGRLKVTDDLLPSVSRKVKK